MSSEPYQHFRNKSITVLMDGTNYPVSVADAVGLFAEFVEKFCTPVDAPENQSSPSIRETQQEVQAIYNRFAKIYNHSGPAIDMMDSTRAIAGLRRIGDIIQKYLIPLEKQLNDAQSTETIATYSIITQITEQLAQMIDQSPASTKNRPIGLG